MTSPVRRRLILALGAAAMATSLPGCGFQLRGPRPLPFSSIHLGVSTHSDLGSSLRRRILANGNTEVVDDPAKAEVRLEILQNAADREILTLTGAGKVREYELRHTMTFRLVGRNGAEWVAPTTIAAKREYNFDDSQVLAKEQEEALLFRDMQADLVDQLIRRLAAANP
ncbi:MAG: LPS assembly lipoprotein LptE [Aromatoleum sp.]|jgi:LPS-assembly lipoprotein|uniref:LPS-assembly lipoprotein LptE n=1 Tax=Aromatoleum sp. TaxID=2307007 RepID=UPI002894941E|nr:LPS assembly lipoprotein LptE [Aromatoleum sp.]MDT3670733.1 LPS assembly lipoprotein LptE [Aromatoleum sp.]